MNKLIKYGLSVVFLLSGTIHLIAQQKTLPLNRLRAIEVDRGTARGDSISHQGFKPYLEQTRDLTTVFGHQKDSTKYYYKASLKFFRDNLFIVNQPNFKATLDPLFDLQLGHDYSDVTELQDTALIFNNTRGALLQGDIGTKVSFQTFIYENQTRFPAYMTDYVNARQVVPGQGRIKPFRNGAFDYSSSYGWVSVTPMKSLNLQVGHGKHFIGHGYRSVLLSDVASNYPYLKAQFTGLDNKLQYNWIYAGLQTLERLPLGEVPESLFKRKAASFYYLSYAPHPKLEVGLFESIIWERWDSTGTLPLQAPMFIPLIGANSAIHGLDDANNALLGVNLRITPLKNVLVYGQFMTDNFGDKFAYQAGARFFDVLLNNMHLQFEYNRASADAYGPTVGYQSYSHINQPLGHPMGSEFEEVVGILNYRYRRWYTQIKGHLIRHEEGPSGDIVAAMDQEGIVGVSQTNIVDAQLGIFVNPKTSLNVALGYMHRYWSIGGLDHRTDWFYLTLRTSLFNKYYDI